MIIGDHIKARCGLYITSNHIALARLGIMLQSPGLLQGILGNIVFLGPQEGKTVSTALSASLSPF